MEIHHPVLVGVLVGAAVALALICSVGMMLMREALQRLNFSAAVTTFSTLLIAIAVWVEEKDPQARVKVILIGVVLFVTNAVLTSSTAKAVRIQREEHWEPHPEEQIPVIGREEVAGVFGATEDHEA